MDDRYIGFYFFNNDMYNLLNNNSIKNVTIRLYNIYNHHNDQVDPRGLTFKLYGHRFSTYNECKELKNMQNNIHEIKQFIAPNNAGAAYIDINLTNTELQTLKPYKGLAFSVVDEDKLTIHDVKCSILYNIQNQEETNGIVLYDHGFINKNTEFKNLCISDFALERNKLTHYLYETFNAFWFSFDGYVNFNNYESFEVTIYTETSRQTPHLHFHLVKYPGEYGFDNTNQFKAIGPWVTRIVTTNKTETTYSISSSDIKYLVKANSSSMGYFGISVDQGELEQNKGEVYITKIVAKRKTS